MASAGLSAARSDPAQPASAGKLTNAIRIHAPVRRKADMNGCEFESDRLTCDSYHTARSIQRAASRFGAAEDAVGIDLSVRLCMKAPD
jgi:hypothetical protein